jgi:hypothetical protein
VSKRVRRHHGVVTLELESYEAALLRRLVEELVELLAEDDQAGQRPAGAAQMLAGVEDPFPGLSMAGPIEPPADPVLARLFPDAYRDDREAAAEFRRYTEADLRAGKRAHAHALLESLDRVEQGGRLQLDGEQAHAWLYTLNDLRLALGTRLDITEDYEALADSLGDEDPRQPVLALYEWLTGLQDTLVRALS